MYRSPTGLTRNMVVLDHSVPSMKTFFPSCYSFSVYILWILASLSPSLNSVFHETLPDYYSSSVFSSLWTLPASIVSSIHLAHVICRSDFYAHILFSRDCKFPNNGHMLYYYFCIFHEKPDYVYFEKIQEAYTHIHLWASSCVYVIMQ